MTGMDIKFMNRPNDDGTVSTFTIEDCLIAPNGAPTVTRPQVTVHLPKSSEESVRGAWFEYDGDTFHVVGPTQHGTTPQLMKPNTPTRWNRYCIAERIY